MGVKIEESAGRVVPTVHTEFEEPAFVELTVAGADVSGEFRCADCGYGVVIHRVLPLCPMCGGSVWELCGPATPQLAD